MDDPLNLSMFRAYDIRTPAELLTLELARRLAHAEAAYFIHDLQVDTVVVAHDARAGGPHYLSLSADVFRDAGLNVIYIPSPCSTPQLYYAAMRHPQAAAIMFGASHNPAGDTGQKILEPGVKPVARGIGTAGGLDRIQELYESEQATYGSRRGSIRAHGVREDYIDFSMQLAGVAPNSLRGLSILHEYLFGAAGPEFMLAFERAGAALEPMHFTPDGGFPLGDPNPVKPEVIRGGLDALRAGNFQMGMFLDGDGDRIDVYLSGGRYLASSFVYAAILPEIRRRYPDSPMGVFADLKSNPLAVIEMAKAGVDVDVIRNGHSQIKQSLLLESRRFGAVEESAHFYEAFPGPNGERFCTENSLYTALLVARMFHEHPQRFEELYRLQETISREREWSYLFPTDEHRADALAAVQAHFSAASLRAMQQMRNGMDLEATLMRGGLPFEIHEDTRLADDWIQVCQRVSQSENGLARWEVVGANAKITASAKAEIGQIVARFGAGEERSG